MSNPTEPTITITTVASDGTEQRTEVAANRVATDNRVRRHFEFDVCVPDAITTIDAMPEYAARVFQRAIADAVACLASVSRPAHTFINGTEQPVEPGARQRIPLVIDGLELPDDAVDGTK